MWFQQGKCAQERRIQLPQKFPLIVSLQSNFSCMPYLFLVSSRKLVFSVSIFKELSRWSSSNPSPRIIRRFSSTYPFEVIDLIYYLRKILTHLLSHIFFTIRFLKQIKTLTKKETFDIETKTIQKKKTTRNLYN